MPAHAFQSWRDVRDEFFRFSQLDRADRDTFWFRGQAQNTIRLRTTLDRACAFDDDVQREKHLGRLIDAFRQEALTVGLANLPTGIAAELLARHHGLSSVLLDWSRSPWVAAFFAASGVEQDQTEDFSIYVLNRRMIPDQVLVAHDMAPPQIELIDDVESLGLNARAIRQRGTFMRVSTIRAPLENLLGPALQRFDLPAHQAQACLIDLDQMQINFATLMNDLDAVARTIELRFHRRPI